MKVLPAIPCLFLLFFLTNQVKSQGRYYVEDFTTTEYKDSSNTTANWDTVGGELKLFPFELTLAGNFDIPDNARGVDISGDYAFIAYGLSGLQVIDISDPTNPTSAGSYNTPGRSNDIAISGDYAYVADFTSLQVIDISDPTNPAPAGSYETPGVACGIAISGDYAYVADDDSVQVFDISDPTTPIVAGSCSTPGLAYDVAISGDYAYVADMSFGLQVINISDPTNPTLVGFYDTPGDANGVNISGNYAYVADMNSGLQVINISDPTNPTPAGSYDTPGDAYGVNIFGNYAYVADLSAGLQVIDISVPTNLSVTGNYDTPGSAYSVAISGIYAYVADYDFGLQVIKIAQLVLPPSFAGSYDTPGSAYDVAISGNYAYVTDQGSGLHVMNITDPTNPTLVGSYDTPGSAFAVAISGDYAYVADLDSGLQVININDPTNPTIAGSYDTPDLSYGLAIFGDYVYVADGDSGLQVIDISDPTNPALAGSCDTPDDALNVVISGDYAYVAVGAAGLQVIDISDPTNPALGGSCATLDDALNIAIAGDYAYVAVGTAGLQVIDISAPTNPTSAGSYDTPSSVYDVTIFGDYAYVADGDSGLQVIDISDPTNPAPAGCYDTPGNAYGVLISGDYAYVMDGYSGLQVIEVFNRSLNFQNNIGQSLNINNTANDIPAVRLTSTQLDSISWALSPDSGANWETVIPDGYWYNFTATGCQLLYRSTHTYSGGGINPTCSNLEIEWLFNFALIDSIKDVPDDQGGWVYIYFTRSGLDFVEETEYPITDYYFFRRIDEDNLQNRIITQGHPLGEEKEHTFSSNKQISTIPSKIGISQVYFWEGRYFLLTSDLIPNDPPPGTWEIVGSVSANQQHQYTCLVPTLTDSGLTFSYSVYCISAQTTTPSVSYFSSPDSGYSIDNLVPSRPTNLYTSLVGSAIQLVWDPIPDGDFYYYAIYRSILSGFVPGSENLLDTTTDTVYHDSQVSLDTTYYYRVSAFDSAGNEGPYSDEVSCLFTNIGKYDIHKIPRTFSLYQNYPNPFNPNTTIIFDIPEPSFVKLQVFNSIGEEIQTLISEEMVPGRYYYNWNANSFASGVYFYRLKTDNFVKTKKMFLMK